MFKHSLVLFLLLLTDLSFGQIVLTQTQSDAIIGLDRKAWAGLGNTSPLSDGYAHDFSLPASTISCQQITGIEIEISLTNYTNNNVCPHFETYYNLFYGCTSYAGGATCLPATNLIAEPNYPVNVNPASFNFGNPLGSPVNPNIAPDFGENLSIDIIPVSNPGCNPVTNGHISYQYTITVTITVTDTTPTEPTTPLECWETRSFDNIACDWIVTGTQPTQPNTACWETVNFNNNTCMWEVSGTQPTQPALECWETASFNSISCAWEITGTQPAQPNLECWETATFNNITCSWEVVGNQPAQPTLECWETATFNNTTCAWDVSGSQPVQPTIECWQTTLFNTMTCSWDISGMQPPEPTTACWETALFNTIICDWEVTGTQPAQPNLECWQTASFNETNCLWELEGTQPGNIIETFVNFCPNDDKQLTAQTDIPNPSYLWSNGEITESVEIAAEGTYTVEISGGICSFETRIFDVSILETPMIESIESDGRNIIVNISNPGNVQYSLNGNTFQNNNTFFNIEGGLYTISVREANCIETVTAEHLHFYIPKFFTPNNDGVNDTFNLGGIAFFSSSEVSIFNRYGKLMKYSRNSAFSWNGTLRGQNLPSDDYWYVIIIEGQKFTGHFTLKR